MSGNAGGDGQDPKAKGDGDGKKPEGQDPKGEGGAGGDGKKPAGQDPPKGQDPKPDTKDEAELKRARDDAAKERQRRKAAEDRTAAILKAAGIDPDGEIAKDPDKAAATIKAQRQEIAQLRGRATFDEIAKEANADAELTWAVLTADGKLASVDFTDKAAIKDLVVAAVKANAKLSASGTKKAGAGAADDGGGATGSVNNFIRRMAGRTT